MTPQLLDSTTEANLIRRCISQGDIVFDVGANQGLWSELALQQNPAKLHLFEPIENCYNLIRSKFSNLIGEGQIFILNFALADCSGSRNFYYYPKYPSLSTIYRRVKAENVHKLGEPLPPVLVQTSTIDDYCKSVKVPHINYLKIDVEGAEFDVIKGASRMLSEHNIDCVEFEYGGTYLDSSATLEGVYKYLKNLGYWIYKASVDVCKNVPTWDSIYENYEYAIFIASLPQFTGKLN